MPPPHSPDESDGIRPAATGSRPILVFYASAGGGHRSAAYAVGEALPEAGWKGPVEVVDALGLMPAWFRWIYSTGYLTVVQAHPFLWSWGYDVYCDLYSYRADPAFVRWIRGLIAHRLRAFIRRRRPAAIVSTHFTASDVVSDMRVGGRLDAWCGTVVTDIASHAIWAQQGLDAYFLAYPRQQAEMRAMAEVLGMPPGAMIAAGIPTRRAFRRPADVEGVRELLGLRPGVPCLVVMAGTRDRGTVMGLLEQLGRIGRPLEILLISGRNRQVRAAVDRFSGHPHLRIHDLGTIDFIQDVFAVGDLVITKAGGSTISECLVSGLPMVIFRPYKGQEEENTDFLVERGAAIRLVQFAGMAQIVGELLEEEDRLAAMRRACLAAARPEAAVTIARRVVEGIRARGEPPEIAPD